MCDLLCKYMDLVPRSQLLHQRDRVTLCATTRGFEQAVKHRNAQARHWQA
jgi:hypothetical protein